MLVQIQQKTYDAVIGDMTILADRLQYVDFTLPYAESGLAMIVPTKPEGSRLMFSKPFTRDMWLVTAAIMIYTQCSLFGSWSANPIQNLVAHGRISLALHFGLPSPLCSLHIVSINLIYRAHDMQLRL